MVCSLGSVKKWVVVGRNKELTDVGVDQAFPEVVDRLGIQTAFAGADRNADSDSLAR